MNRRPILQALIAIVMLSVTADAFAFRPELRLITPRGAQRGTEVDVYFTGARLTDPEDVLFYGEGIELIEFKPSKKSNVAIAKVRISSDCKFGEHIMRLRTKRGITEAMTFFVGPYPTVEEKEPNSEFASPQAVPMNSTVHGIVQSEDVDYYVVKAKKGDRISAEIEAIRLGTYMFDAYVAILNSKRFELSASDDTALLLQDAFASAVAPEDGEYIIQVRESSYGGNGNCRYRLHVGQFPRPKAIYPMGGKAGSEVEFTFIGDVRGVFKQKVKLPATPLDDHGIFASHEGQEAPSANPIRVSEFDNVMETEPNDSLGQASAASMEPPLAFNGVMGDGDVYDWFKFKSKKGRVFDIRVYAQRLGSPLDSVLYVYDLTTKKRIASNDDSGGGDSYYRLRVPRDGEYAVGIRDHLKAGGEHYVYRIEVASVKPSVEFEIPEFVRYKQDRNRIVVPQGNRFAQVLRFNRESFRGDLQLEAPNLPKGMKLVTKTIPASAREYPVVFEADADAPIGGGLFDVVAREIIPTKDGKPTKAPDQAIVGQFRQKLDLVFGNPNQTVYYGSQVHRMAIGVAEKVPFKVTIEQPKAPIVRAGSKNIKVTVQRDEGFDGEITLSWLWRPAGIGATGSVKIAKGKNEAYYPITANGSAAIGKWPMAILASASLKEGPVWTSTQLAELEIAAPFLAMSIGRVAAEQGKSVDVIAKLTQTKEYEGKARVILHGIPAHVTTEKREQQVTKDTEELVFPMVVDKKARAGQHKSLFCQVIVPFNGEDVVHSVGGGTVFRVDPPPPPKKTPVKPKVVKKEATPKPQPKKPAEKRLTRLEKLRMIAAERAKEEAGK